MTKTMNRNLLFLFFFLATISVINAIPHQFNKRTTVFEACPPTPGNPVDVTVLTASVTPDPIVSNQNAKFIVSGTAKEDIPTDAEISIVYNTSDGFVIGTPFFARFCAVGDSSCPVKQGDTFTRTLQANAPTLPAAYSVTILINTTGPETVYGCALATVKA